MLPVGAVLRGTYRIEGFLASGGFGNTYLARNAFNELVAIKEFYVNGVNYRDHQSSTVSVSNTNNQLFFDEQLKKFKKEALRLRQIKHENIVGVHDLFDENGTAYYVMDYIDGESLSQRIERTNMPIGERDAMNYFMQILDALEAVHDKGIWHLDLKPGNIMLDKNGAVKLIDFGASKQQSGQDGGATSTAVAFTSGFAPREQMEQNISKFGPWTDLYALGATLYNLLTTYGPPLPSDLDDDSTPEKSRALPMPYVSLKVKRLILWMMNTNRMDRPQSVAEVRNFLLREPEPATTISPVKNKNPQQGQQPAQLAPSRKSIAKPQKAVEVTSLDPPAKKKGAAIYFIIAGIAAAIVIGLYAMGVFGGAEEKSESGNEPSKEVTTELKKVENLDYSIESLGICKYSGEVNDVNQPHGKGKAEFSDGRIYVGPFVNGKCQGENAFFKYNNGDTFEGSFDNNHFKEGKYTSAEDKVYFIGTFTNGDPDKGKWYDKDGKEMKM